MLIEHDGKRPRLHPDCRIAPNAVICGDVTVGPNVSIGFGAVLTAESGPIRIGANVVVMDTAVIRGVRDAPASLGDNVLIGPRAVLSGCTIEDEVFIATGATVLNHAHVGRGAEVRINGIVHIKTRVPAGTTVPIGWVAVGEPCEILPAENHERIWAAQKPLDFPRTVFGLDRPAAGDSIMPRIMPRYAAALRRHSRDRDMVAP